MRHAERKQVSVHCTTPRAWPRPRTYFGCADSETGTFTALKQ